MGLVVLFLASLWGLVRGEHRGPSADALLLDPSSEVQLGDEWLGLYFKGDKVGLVHLHKQGREGGGFEFVIRTRLRLLKLHDDAAIDLEVRAELSDALALERFAFEVKAGPGRMTGGGTVDGHAIDFRLHTGGADLDRRIELDHPPVLRSTLGPLLGRSTLTPGARLRFHTFDPLTMRDQEVEVEVVGPDTLVVMGREVPATHIRQAFGGITLDGWINQRGEMLRQELGLGLVAVRETEEEARWGLAGAGALTPEVDFFGATLIPVEGLPEVLPADRERLSVRLGGADLTGFELDGDRQRFEEGVLTVRREASPRGLALPVRDAPPDTLAATPLVQSDHPRIKSRARAVAGDAADTVEAARRIARWVQDNLEQQLVPGVPSALETLEARVGDCNEHSTLFAALARAAGVPTRLAVGLVYRDGRFGYHAWNEVLAQEGWVTVDATWGQLPADVGHLRFVTGGLDRQVDLLRLMGRLTVEIVPDTLPVGDAME